jgi:hypothetical protein
LLQSCLASCLSRTKPDLLRAGSDASAMFSRSDRSSISPSTLRSSLR